MALNKGLTTLSTDYVHSFRGWRFWRHRMQDQCYSEDQPRRRSQQSEIHEAEPRHHCNQDCHGRPFYFRPHPPSFTTCCWWRLLTRDSPQGSHQRRVRHRVPFASRNAAVRSRFETIVCVETVVNNILCVIIDTDCHGTLQCRAI